jgi:hypothetical protein
VTPFTHKTEHYYGSKKQVHTISWKGHGEVDSQEIRDWCINNLGNPGYQEEHECSRWLDDAENGEIILCNDSDLTFFLLKWT